MRYEVTVFGMLKDKKTRIWSIHVEAANAREAVAQSGADQTANRIVEVKEVESSSVDSPRSSIRSRPLVNRIERDGLT